MSSPAQLLKDCCIPDAVPRGGNPSIGLGLASPRILRAGEHVDFLSVGLTATDRELFARFNVERDHIRTRICYCSVFDECWIKEGGDELLQKGQSKLIHPDRVKSCPAPPSPYQLSNAMPGRP